MREKSRARPVSAEPETPPVVPDLPQTGDNMKLHMWFAVLFVCNGGMIITFVLGKKEKQKTH